MDGLFFSIWKRDYSSGSMRTMCTGQTCVKTSMIAVVNGYISFIADDSIAYLGDCPSWEYIYFCGPCKSWSPHLQNAHNIYQCIEYQFCQRMRSIAEGLNWERLKQARQGMSV